MRKSRNKPSSSRPVVGRADLHIHSSFSDGAATIEEILDHVEENTKLDIIAITDHDTIGGALLASEIVRRGKYRFNVIAGEEITTQHGDVIGLYLQKNILPHQSFEETIKQILAQDGLVMIPHPNLYAHHIHPQRILRVLKEHPKAISAIEVSSFILFNKDSAREWLAISQRHAVAPVAGSDSHELSTIGRASTVFRGNSLSDMRMRLKAGDTMPQFKHLNTIEKLSFFRHAATVNISRRLHMNGYHVNKYVPKLSPTRLAVRTAQHYLGLPY